MFFCPDRIPPNSGLTGPNNTIYTVIHRQICFVLSELILWLDILASRSWD